MAKKASNVKTRASKAGKPFGGKKAPPFAKKGNVRASKKGK